ncbi:MAG: hypothetical protein ACRCSU_05920 [Paracoccaceae bacterium]
MNLIHLLRMSKWARNPPSRRQVIIGAIAIGGALLLAGVEYFIGWPEWATVNQTPRQMPKP